MIHTSNAVSARWFRTFDNLAPSLAIEPIAAPIQERTDIESAIERLARKPKGGLIVPGDTFLERPSNRRMLVELTASHRVPALFTQELVRKGGRPDVLRRRPDRPVANGGRLY